MNINKYPYTDFHELNLDWFLAQFKTLTDAWDSQQANYEQFKEDVTTEFNNLSGKFDTLDETVQSFTRFITNYFDNLDVQQEINNKLDELVADGTMTELIRPIFDAYAAQMTQRMNVLEGRMDQFASLPDGSTAGDAELLDIRVGPNGVAYSSAGNAVRAISDCFIVSPNLFDFSKITKGKYMTDTGSIGTNAIYCYTDYIPVNPGDTLYCTFVPRYMTCFDANKGYIAGGSENPGTLLYINIGGVSYPSKQITIPANTYYVILTGLVPSYESQQKIRSNSVVTTNAIPGQYYRYGELLELKSSKLPKIPINMIEDNDNLMLKSEYVKETSNLFNIDTITRGSYISNTGEVFQNASYCHTDYIPVNPGDDIYCNVQMRFIAAFNQEKISIPSAGAESVNGYIVPTDVYYIIVSIPISVLNESDNKICISKGTLLAYSDYGDHIKNKKAPAQSVINIGHNSIIVSKDTLSVDASIFIPVGRQPFNMRKNYGLTFEADFASFGQLTIGCGYNGYRGKWLVITNTVIEVYVYESSPSTLLTTITHGLNINKHIAISMWINDLGQLELIINSPGNNTFRTTISGNPYEMHKTGFAYSSTELTNVKLSYTMGDILNPCWMFGDSYFGYDNARVIGQLLNNGFGKKLCYNAIAGASAAVALDDFKKMLAFACPKYVVWAMGMNGADSDSITALNTLISICRDNDIELILYKVPAVPGLLHTSYNAAVEASGYRYIDAYKAVGCDGAGAWYNGYLSSDNVHPTALGAQAIAMQFIIDFPELTQYNN